MQYAIINGQGGYVHRMPNTRGALHKRITVQEFVGAKWGRKDGVIDNGSAVPSRCKCGALFDVSKTIRGRRTKCAACEESEVNWGRTTCTHCKQEFQRPSKNAKYCTTSSCQDAKRLAMGYGNIEKYEPHNHSYTCAWKPCGKQFTGTYRRNNTAYCSQECARLSHYAKERVRKKQKRTWPH